MTYGSFCVYGVVVCFDMFTDIWMIFGTYLARVLIDEIVRLNRPYFV